MDTRETRDVPGRLEAVRRRFEGWRHTRKQRSPIPDSLWAAAVKLADQYGLCRTARTLRVDYYSLKKRIQAASAAEHDRPTFRGGGRGRSAPGPGNGPFTTFVELPSASPLSGGCIVELESAAGAKLRVELQGVAMPDMIALARSFWDHAP